MRFAKVNESIQLFMQLEDGAVGLFPQARVLNAASQTIQTLNLQPVVDRPGFYQQSTTIPQTGQYSIRYLIYQDAGYTQESATYSLTDEAIEIVAANQQAIDQTPVVVQNLGTEFRKGIAFNNPDLTSDHHAPGWGLCITPDEMRYLVLYGTKLVSPDANQVYDDPMLQYYIDNALATVERDLQIDIVARKIRYSNFIDELTGDEIPRTGGGEAQAQVPQIPGYTIPADEIFEQETGYPYRAQHARHYMYLKLRRRPLQKVVKCFIQDPVNRQFVDLMPWRKEMKGLEAKLQFFPNLTSVGNYPYFFTSLIQVRYPFNDYPDAIKVDYDVGYERADKVPADLREIIRMVAGYILLNDFGDGKSPALASASTSLNSISESYTTTQSATNALYGARIIQFQNQIKAWEKKNGAKFRRNVFGVL